MVMNLRVGFMVMVVIVVMIAILATLMILLMMAMIHSGERRQLERRRDVASPEIQEQSNIDL